MFWFDKNHPNALFIDKRKEEHVLCDGRRLSILPDMVADFTKIPFRDEQFDLVVFDPPHLKCAGPKSWQKAKYGKLEGDWKTELSNGFMECFRVLRSGGTLIFKWNEVQIPVNQIIKLSGRKPLFGNRTGKQSKTHWIVFNKLAIHT